MHPFSTGSVSSKTGAGSFCIWCSYTNVYCRGSTVALVEHILRLHGVCFLTSFVITVDLTLYLLPFPVTVLLLWGATRVSIVSVFYWISRLLFRRGSLLPITFSLTTFRSNMYLPGI